jgi:uncharacterized membrane protein YheB (UPF0754 family)
MASIAVDKGLAKLGSISDFYRELEPDRIAEHLAAIAQSEIREVVDQIMEKENPQLWHDLPPVIKEAVFARVRAQLPHLVRNITDEIGENVDQLIDAKLMVIAYFREHPELLNELFLIMGRKELTFMQNFGFYFGFPMGFALFGILQLYSAWWILPLGGVIIGWVVNWIGVTMIFEPVFPKRWVPWRQGLLIKRQPEVTEMYSQMVADKVITLQNIGNELMNGRRSDRTMQLLEDSLRPAVDRAVGPAQPAVRVAVGTEEYDAVRESLAQEAVGYTTKPLQDPDFNREQSEQIRKLASKRIEELAPREYSELLRSAIRQDEWLLIAHGGALGLVSGGLHALLFPV